MDIHQLELFLAVMDSPSMTRAAEKVFLSPGAVSLQLHNLADELHTELFVRSGKRLIPTPAALRLAEHAKTLVELTHQIKQEFENDVAKDTRPFNFATGVTTLIYQLGKPLRQLRKQYPKAQIRVSVSVTEETVRGLHDRRFDLGLISLPVPEENLTIIPLFDEELLIVGPATNKSRRGHIGSIRPVRLGSGSLPALSPQHRATGTHRSFLQGYRCYPSGCNGSRRHGSYQAFGGIGFRLLCSSRTRVAPADPVLPCLSRRRASGGEGSGIGDGAHGVSAQADRVDRGISAIDPGRLKEVGPVET